MEPSLPSTINQEPSINHQQTTEGTMSSQTGLLSRPIVPQYQSPLLRLPGEIRNKVYGYALNPYCSREECELPSDLDPSDLPDILVSEEPEIDMISAMLPSDTEDVKSPCHLYFQESRYDYDWKKVNQLKYVCRQLHLETRSFSLDEHSQLCFLSFKYTPAVPKKANYNPGRAFVRFLKSCDPAYFTRSRRIDIEYLVQLTASPAGFADGKFIIRDYLDCLTLYKWSGEVRDAINEFHKGHKNLNIYLVDYRKNCKTTIRFDPSDTEGKLVMIASDNLESP